MALPDLALSRSTLDRASHLRKDPELLAKLLADDETRVVPLVGGQAPTRRTATGASLVTGSAAQWAGRWGAPGDAAFLGVARDGRSWVAVALPETFDLQDGESWAGLREVGTVLDDTEAGVLTSSVAVLAWHAANPHCARCGHRSEPASAGWTRQCPACGAEHYPRTDPAVIMTIVDPDDRVLLGRQSVWPEHRYSALAGFVEPGEPLEDAVRREVLEESGIVVGEVNYLGSQPWPFPSSLMLGFTGRALTTAIQVDGEELADARWWSREALVADMAAGTLLLPPAVSIARRLIEHWYGGPLPADADWH